MINKDYKKINLILMSVKKLYQVKKIQKQKIFQFLKIKLNKSQ